MLLSASLFCSDHLSLIVVLHSPYLSLFCCSRCTANLSLIGVLHSPCLSLFSWLFCSVRLFLTVVLHFSCMSLFLLCVFSSSLLCLVTVLYQPCLLCSLFFVFGDCCTLHSTLCPALLYLLISLLSVTIPLTWTTPLNQTYTSIWDRIGSLLSYPRYSLSLPLYYFVLNVL